MFDLLTAAALREKLDEITENLSVMKKSLRLVQDQVNEARINISTLKKQERERKKTDNFKQWTDEDQVAAVKRFFVEFQRIPIKNDFDSLDWLPASTSVFRRWGSLAALREAAGLDGGFKGRGGSGRGGGWTAERKRKPFEKSKTHEADNN